MRNLQELRARVDDGAVVLVNAVGVPRSMSTAFCRALSQGDIPSIYVNEPFNRNNSDLDMSAATILADCSQRGAERTLIVTKNMASYLSLAAFRDLDALAAVTIWNVRNPLIQLGSLVTRIANDLYVQPGADELTQDDAYAYLDRVCQFLCSSPRSYNYSKTGWQGVANLHALEPQAPWVAIDGTNFVEAPEVNLRSVCDMLGVPYSPAMCDGWYRGFNNVVNQDNVDETLRSAWTSQAAISRRVETNMRVPLDFERLPYTLQDHIVTVALPAYQRVIADQVC